LYNFAALKISEVTALMAVITLLLLLLGASLMAKRLGGWILNKVYVPPPLDLRSTAFLQSNFIFQHQAVSASHTVTGLCKPTSSALF